MPVTRPTPAMITTMRAFKVYSTPLVALKEMNVLTSIPDVAASAPPAANVSAENRRTSMPTRPAATGSIVMARRAAPTRV